MLIKVIIIIIIILRIIDTRSMALMIVQPVCTEC